MTLGTMAGLGPLAELNLYENFGYVYLYITYLIMFLIAGVFWYLIRWQGSIERSLRPSL